MSKFGDAIKGRLERLAKKVEVPEWGEGDKPLDLYFYPMTINDAKKLNGYVKSKGEGGREDEYVYYIIFNALDKNGEKAFDLADAEWIGNQPLNVIVDIYLAANQRKGFDETLKK